MTFIDYYELLGVDRACDAETIARAIRAQRLAWRRRASHPRAATTDLAVRVVSHLSQAEAALLDPARREAYDIRLRSHAPAPAPAAASGREQLRLVHELLAAGRISDAGDAAREATRLLPESAEAWYLCAVASHARGRTADAELELYEATRLDAAEATYHCELGDLYVSVRLPAAARAAYRRAGELDPRAVYPRFAEATIAGLRGYPEAALPALERAVREDPGNELFRLHYAMALAEATMRLWSQHPDGSRAILNEAQLAASRHGLQRIRELHVRDPELERRTVRIAAAIESAQVVGWHGSSELPFYLVGLVCAIVGGGIAVGLAWSGSVAAWPAALFFLAAVVAIPALFVARHRVVGWQWAHEHSPEPVRRTGLQAPGSGPPASPS